MASTRRGRPVAQPASIHPRRGRLPRRPLIIWLSLCVIIPSVALLTHPGATAVSQGHRFLEYYSGVFSLVALSLTVMGGIVATDRLVLLVRHRVLMQAVHRATAM